MQPSVQASVAPSFIEGVQMPHLKARVSILRFWSASGRSSASSSCSLSRTSSSVSGTACTHASFHAQVGTPGLSVQIHVTVPMTNSHVCTTSPAEVATHARVAKSGRIIPALVSLNSVIFRVHQPDTGAHPHYNLHYILGPQVDHIPYPQHNACMPQRFAYPLCLFIRLCCSAAWQLLSLPLPSSLAGLDSSNSPKIALCLQAPSGTQSSAAKAASACLTVLRFPHVQIVKVSTLSH